MGAARTARAAADSAGAAAIRILTDEHLAIASVLYSLRTAVRRNRDEGVAPDLAFLRAALDFVIAFPEMLHHPKESDYLFAALLARWPAAQPLIGELEAEHARGASLIDDLADALERCSRDDRTAFDVFARSVEAYADFHWQHMAKEEDLLLPLARRHLTAGDWDTIEAAFRANDNPLRGIRPKEQSARLYREILRLAPFTARARIATRRGSP